VFLVHHGTATENGGGVLVFCGEYRTPGKYAALYLVLTLNIMIKKISFSLFSLFFSAVALFAQASPEPVNSPQRGTTYADNAGVWYNQPFVWIGALILILVVVLLILRKKNTAINKPNPT
jgi:hypothetical protein